MTSPSYPHGVRVTLGQVLEERGMSLVELAKRTGVSRTNLDKLKNGRATGMVWSTLGAVCRELECQPGDVLQYHPDKEEEDTSARGQEEAAVPLPQREEEGR